MSAFITDKIEAIDIQGKRFVTTGLSEADNEAFERYIKENSGLILSGVSGKTDYLVVNTAYDHVTVKYKKAVELREAGKPVAIIDYEDFKGIRRDYGKHGNTVIDGASACPAKTDSREEKPVIRGKRFYIGEWDSENSEPSFESSFAEYLRKAGGIVEKTLNRFTDYYIELPYKHYWSRYEDEKVSQLIERGSICAMKYDRFMSLQADSSGFVTAGEKLFKYIGSEEHVVIPDGVRTIGNFAFFGCQNLESVIIPDGVKSIEGAFAKCEKLKSVTIPDSVTNLGPGSFLFCTSLKGIRIPDGVWTIGKYTFCTCSSLKRIIVPQCVSSVPASAFSWCDAALVEFRGRTKLEWDYFWPREKAADTMMFRLYAPLVPVEEIPNECKLAAVRGFCEASDGSEPEEIRKGYITYIKRTKKKYYTFFERYPALLRFFTENRIIPYSDIMSLVDSLNDSTAKAVLVDYSNSFSEGKKEREEKRKNKREFDSLLDASESTVPDVRKLFKYAYKKHEDFIEIEGYRGEDTRVVIPEYIKDKPVRWVSFSNCLKSYNVTNKVRSKLEKVREVVIPDGVTKIDECAFYGCKGLTDITIPDSVTSIGKKAFWGCSSLTSINIPIGVNSIEEDAFFVCHGLTSIAIPDGVTSIGEDAFHGCSSLTSIAIPDGVTYIGRGAFAGCSSLTSIAIPDSVTSIGNRAFCYCSSLICVIIPDSFTGKEENLFAGCSSLGWVTVADGVLTTGKTVPDGVKSMTGISITIPDNVTSIGEDAYYGCRGLTNITIPDSVTYIGRRAFAGCLNLTSITIPESVTSIGESAFEYCCGLTSITIPHSVTSIGNRAFWGCSRRRTTIRCHKNSAAYEWAVKEEFQQVEIIEP